MASWHHSSSSSSSSSSTSECVLTHQHQLQFLLLNNPAIQFLLLTNPDIQFLLLTNPAIQFLLLTNPAMIALPSAGALLMDTIRRVMVLRPNFAQRHHLCAHTCVRMQQAGGE